MNNWSGKEVMALLLRQRRKVTREVIRAIKRNKSSGKEVMALLYKSNIPIPSY